MNGGGLAEPNWEAGLPVVSHRSIVGGPPNLTINLTIGSARKQYFPVEHYSVVVSSWSSSFRSPLRITKLFTHYSATLNTFSVQRAIPYTCL